MIPPDTKPIEDLDPLCAGALRRFIRAQSQVPGLPVEVSLRSVTRIVPAGEPAAVRALVRSLIAQIAVLHSPADVRISVCAPAGPARGTGSGSSGCRTPCTPPSRTRPARCG